MIEPECVECGQIGHKTIVFVYSLMRKDGTIEKLPEGMHPYCESCRDKLDITDELFAGRDLRKEAYEIVLGTARKTAHLSKVSDVCEVIMDELEPWVGGSDRLFGLLGRASPVRPQEVFDGVSDAFSEIDPSSMTPSESLSYITVTFPVKGRISHWNGFVQRTHDYFKTIMTEDDARKCLVGFI